MSSEKCPFCGDELEEFYVGWIVKSGIEYKEIKRCANTGATIGISHGIELSKWEQMKALLRGFWEGWKAKPS